MTDPDLTTRFWQLVAQLIDVPPVSIDQIELGLASPKLATGLMSSDEEVRLAAQGVKASLEELLEKRRRALN